MLGPDGSPVRAINFLAWAAWYETADRRIAESHIETLHGPIRVSTVFLGIDHGMDRRRPVIYESLPFTILHSLDRYMRRYATADEARRGHAAIVDQIIRDHAMPSFRLPRGMRGHRLDWRRLKLPGNRRKYRTPPKRYGSARRKAPRIARVAFRRRLRASLYWRTFGRY